MTRASWCSRAALLALVLLAATGCGSDERRPRNLVLVLVDTLRSDHLPSYGYARDTAPFLARLAAEGVQVQGWAASSWTRPSVATLLTGLLPQRHQAITRGDGLSREAPYLPQRLRDAGYETVAFVANGNAGKNQGFGRGFVRYAQSGVRGKYDGEQVTDRALRSMSEVASPFFLYVHYVDPHDPYRPERSWGDAAPPSVQPSRIGAATLGAAELARLVDAYDGEIREVDRAIERLLRGLDQAGQLDDTLVVVTADHGEEFGDHGGLTHGVTLHEEMLRVPLILWWRGGLSHARSDALFALVDLAPTLLEALGEDVPDRLDGIASWRDLRRARVQERPHLAHLDLDRRGSLALLDGDRKLIHRNTSPHDRLYDVASDAREQRPLALDEPELTAWRVRALRMHNALRRDALSRRESRTRGRLRQQLAALGYLGADTSDAELAHRVVPPGLGASGLADAPQIHLREIVERPSGSPPR